MQCSETPWSCRAAHSAGQCTRSKAFDKSRLTIQIVLPAAVALSKRMFVVNKCSSIPFFLDENHVVLQAVPVPRHFRCGLKPYKRTPCKIIECSQWVWKSLVCMECTFFGNIVNRVNFQDAGICPVRKIKLKASSIAIKYSSGATFNNSAVRPQSSDALLIFKPFNCLHQVCPCPWWIQHRWKIWCLCRRSDKQCF